MREEVNTKANSFLYWGATQETKGLFVVTATRTGHEIWLQWLVLPQETPSVALIVFVCIMSPNNQSQVAYLLYWSLFLPQTFGYSWLVSAYNWNLPWIWFLWLGQLVSVCFPRNTELKMVTPTSSGCSHKRQALRVKCLSQGHNIMT